MKRYLLYLTTTVLFQLWGTAASAQGQACDLHFAKPAGTVYTYENYNRKGELQGTLQQTVVAKQAGSYTMRAQATLANRGTTLPAKDYTIACTGGQIQLNINSFLPPASDDGSWELRSLKDQVLPYPTILQAGTTLPEANYEVEGYTDGQKAGTLKFRLYNRRVTGQQSVTLSAGTFTAWVIESAVTTVWQKEGGRAFTFETIAKEYYAPGVGWLKTESYRQNGKALGYTALKSVQ